MKLENENWFLKRSFKKTICCTFTQNVYIIYFLVSNANDPLSYHVTRLGDTIKEDQPVFCKIVVERSEVTIQCILRAFGSVRL
jgi:hypothetical protein